MSRTFSFYLAAVFLVSCALSFVHAAERSFGEHGHPGEACQFCAGQHQDHAAPTADESARSFPRARYAAKPCGGSPVVFVPHAAATTRAPPLLSSL